MSIRTIIKAFQGMPVIQDADMTLYRAIPTNQIESVGPFVFLDYYNSRKAKGIGDSPHPHAGIEVISYVMQGSGVHTDSMGFTETINGGDVQFIKAGKGILHKEVPQSPHRKGLQLWTSLPPEKKFDKPEYASFRADKVPSLVVNGNTVKVVSGTINQVTGLLTMTAKPTVLAHVNFSTTHEVKLEVDSESELSIFVINGQVSVAGKGPLSEGDLALLSQGSEITLQPMGTESVDVAIVGGEKIDYPLFFDGPFVMDSEENIRQAYRNYRDGTMGTLDGVPR